MDERMLTLRECSDRTGLHIETVRSAYLSLKPGHLRGQLVGGLVFVAECELERWLAERTAQTGWQRHKKASWHARIAGVETIDE